MRDYCVIDCAEIISCSVSEKVRSSSLGRKNFLLVRYIFKWAIDVLVRYKVREKVRVYVYVLLLLVFLVPECLENGGGAAVKWV